MVQCNHIYVERMVQIRGEDGQLIHNWCCKNCDTKFQPESSELSAIIAKLDSLLTQRFPDPETPTEAEKRMHVRLNIHEQLMARHIAELKRLKIQTPLDNPRHIAKGELLKPKKGRKR
jgi:hypothetical protein